MSRPSEFPIKVKLAKAAAAQWDAEVAARAFEFYDSRVHDIAESISRGKLTHADPEWLARAHIALNASRALVRIANDSLHRLGGSKTASTSQTWSREFVRAARARLPKDLFDAIAKLADTAVG